MANNEQPKRTAVVFPGQGSQAKGMGGDLFDQYPDFVRQADAILGYSIKELCLHDPDGVLGQTRFTQPALFVVNALSYQRHVGRTRRTPDFVAGLSLGEYNALLAADSFDFATGLRLVQRRAELMSEASGGGMAAVIGLAKRPLLDTIIRHGLYRLDVANENTPTQFVVSGPASEIARAQPLFEGAGARYVILRVSGAFHSRYMVHVRDAYREFAAGLSFGSPRIPVIANASARSYPSASAVCDHLCEQLTSPVKWTDSVLYMMQQGDVEFVEVGNGSVLTGLIRDIKKAASAEAPPAVVEAPTAEMAS